MSIGEAIAAYYAEQLIKAIAVVAIVLVVGLCVTWRWQPWTLQSDIERLEQRVKAIEKEEGQ